MEVSTLKNKGIFFCLPLILMLSCPLIAPLQSAYAWSRNTRSTRTNTTQAKKSTSRSSSSKEHAAKLNAISSTFRFYNKNLSKSTTDAYAKFVLEAASRYKIDPGLICGLIIKESTVNANARSRSGALGLMQILWRVHHAAIKGQFPHITTQRAIMEPRNNIIVGTWLYAKYLKNARGNERAALTSYLGNRNSGRYIKQIYSFRNTYRSYLNSKRG